MSATEKIVARDLFLRKGEFMDCVSLYEPLCKDASVQLISERFAKPYVVSLNIYIERLGIFLNDYCG